MQVKCQDLFSFEFVFLLVSTIFVIRNICFVELFEDIMSFLLFLFPAFIDIPETLVSLFNHLLLLFHGGQ